MPDYQRNSCKCDIEPHLIAKAPEWAHKRLAAEALQRQQVAQHSAPHHLCSGQRCNYEKERHRRDERQHDAHHAVDGIAAQAERATEDALQSRTAHEEAREDEEREDGLAAHAAQQIEQCRKRSLLTGLQFSVFDEEVVARVAEQHHEGGKEAQGIEPHKVLLMSRSIHCIGVRWLFVSLLSKGIACMWHQRLR